MKKLRYLKIGLLAASLLGATTGFATGYEPGGTGTGTGTGGTATGGTATGTGTGTGPGPAPGPDPGTGTGTGSGTGATGSVAAGGTTYDGSFVKSDFTVGATIQSVVQFLTPVDNLVAWEINPLEAITGQANIPVLHKRVCIYTNMPQGVSISISNENGMGDSLEEGLLVSNSTSHTFNYLVQLSGISLQFNGSKVPLTTPVVSQAPCNDNASSGADLAFYLNVPAGVRIPAGEYADTLKVTIEPN